MELHCSQTILVTLSSLISLRPLWNYTALKPVSRNLSRRFRLRPLWNYTALKHKLNISADYLRLRPLWNYTALKPNTEFTELPLFETPMELHCSQTLLATHSSGRSLRPLWNYTALKRDRGRS